MAKTIVVVGYGPGISNAVAERFGKAGFSVALVARDQAKLDKGVASLKEKKIEAAACRGDASDPASLRAAIGKARALGPIHAIHWNAYGANVGDVLEASPKELHEIFDVSIVGLVTAVQETLPDLKKAGDGAVLVTNGAFGEVNPQVDAFAASSKFMGLAIANAAKHKLVGLLAERLRGDGVHVGEVMVAGTVKGTAWDRGQATLDASAIADQFWKLFEGRKEVRVRVS